MSEAFWQEVEPLGIKVMGVEASGFRADWAGRSANESKREIDDYAATAGARISSTARRTRSSMRSSPRIRRHYLLLGNAAYDLAMAKLDVLRKEFSAWEAVAHGGDS